MCRPGRKMLDPGLPCHNYPTSSRVVSRITLSWDLLPARNGRPRSHGAKGNPASRTSPSGVGLSMHTSPPAPSSRPKALMVVVSGRPTALRGTARRGISPTAGLSSGRRHQSLNNSHAQLTGRRGRHWTGSAPRMAWHGIASHHTAAAVSLTDLSASPLPSGVAAFQEQEPTTAKHVSQSGACTNNGRHGPEKLVPTAYPVPTAHPGVGRQRRCVSSQGTRYSTHITHVVVHQPDYANRRKRSQEPGLEC
ncbi:hypothetical protein QBC39DRAFT_338603 [Podospora conica]|nr:hypothetical protein QBC39DRAFT_338603 [Schizothecium conicum]